MKLKRKVLKFRKARYGHGGYGLDSYWYEVRDSSLIRAAMDMLKDYDGYLVSLKSHDSFSTRRCKLTVMIPESEWMKFVSDYMNTFTTETTDYRWK